MSRHVFTIEAEFDSSEEYEAFCFAVSSHGGDIVEEESDHR